MTNEELQALAALAKERAGDTTQHDSLQVQYITLQVLTEIALRLGANGGTSNT